jgi:hypothetical protein
MASTYDLALHATVAKELFFTLLFKILLKVSTFDLELHAIAAKVLFYFIF